MPWEEYKPKPRGRQPRDYAAMIKSLDSEPLTAEYGSKQSCDKLLENLQEAAVKAKIRIKSRLDIGTGSDKGRYLLTVTKVV